MTDREREEQESGFKINDRRLFNAEGERRKDAEPEQPRREPPQASGAERVVEMPPPRPEQASRPDAQPQPHPGLEGERHADSRGPVTFEHLVMSLATTAMFQLGLVKSPEEQNPAVDLPAAKETITLLEILQQKTKGNLTPDEESLMEGSLYELHMVFVELTKAAGRNR
jgi:hypothetical protein